MKLARKIWLIILAIALSPTLSGWGYEGHRRINYIASFQLKNKFGQFLSRHANELKIYGAVPDYQKGMDKSRYHHHFIDADYYDKYPFDNIPRDHTSFYKKYGDDTKKMGDAPFFIEKLCNRIIYLMKNNRFEEALYNMGELGHYIADIHQPLHVILNYNGQKTGNNGVHFRWEIRLIDEYVKRINPVGNIEKISDPVSFAFDIVKESFSYHQKILEADTKAREVLTKDQAKQLVSYDILDFEKPYLDILYLETKDLLNDRLGRSVVRLASIWQYCWEQAGKPDLP
tara:strand:- start:101 stop:958 length:858 start_codon:yes stop_codon:yes gene_type:complete